MIQPIRSGEDDEATKSISKYTSVSLASSDHWHDVRLIEIDTDLPYKCGDVELDLLSESVNLSNTSSSWNEANNLKEKHGSRQLALCVGLFEIYVFFKKKKVFSSDIQKKRKYRVNANTKKRD
jgi:hypothetical protein